MLTRIGILGLGGVGGYFGGLLAKAYAESDQSKLYLLLAVKRKAIAESGLTIITDENEITVFPNIVSDDPLTIGKLDYLICATKTYDIEESLRSLEKCITKTLSFFLYIMVSMRKKG
jgi:2-dehydropantoate 2-reductase